MNILDLERKLKQLKIPKDAYSLHGGLPSEVHCIERTKNGWNVYYSEKGLKTGLTHFTDENCACDYFYQWMLMLFN